MPILQVSVASYYCERACVRASLRLLPPVGIRHGNGICYYCQLRCDGVTVRFVIRPPVVFFLSLSLRAIHRGADSSSIPSCASGWRTCRVRDEAESVFRWV